MYTVLRANGDYIANDEGIYKEYVCDAESDISTLPTGKGGSGINRPRPGSVALITGTSSVYVLSNAREWVALIEG